ncbi:MAG: hypothetical protein KDN22_33150 [Verrucomicrobiae bacterium]|nr:hypothetical protein [Verrucomicrobiae bacterium]
MGDRITREFYERLRNFNCWVFSVIQQFGRFYDIQGGLWCFLFFLLRRWEGLISDEPG